MKGTALLIKKDHSVKILENVEKSVCEELTNNKDQVVFYNENIDWDYGY